MDRRFGASRDARTRRPRGRGEIFFLPFARGAKASTTDDDDRSIGRSRGGWLASRRGDAARRRPSLASPLASARRRLLPLANDVADAIPLCPVSLPSSRRRRGTGWMRRIFISASPPSVRASPSHLIIRRRSVSPRRVSRPLARRRRALAGERPTDARSRLASTATTGVAAAAPAPRRKRPDRFFYRRSVKTSAATACRRAREKKKKMGRRLIAPD